MRVGFIMSFICAFFLLATPKLEAQRRGVVINNRTSVKTNLNDRIKKLSQEITFGQETDEGKARAIFNWLATNIPYDHELRFDKKLQKQIYISENYVVENVLNRKKALCGGYAFLFNALCKDLGIKTKAIHGYSVKHGVPKSKSIDHTWNAVYLNGTWKLLDITYARGMSGGGEFMGKWFDCEPKSFLKTHEPQESKWSLISRTR